MTGHRPPSFGDEPPPNQPEAPTPPGDDDATLVQPAVPGPSGADEPTLVQPRVPPPPPPPRAPVPPQPPQTPWWRRGWAILLWVALAVLLTLGVVQLTSGDDEPTTSTASTPSTGATSTTGPSETSTSAPAGTTSAAPSTTTTTPPTTTTTTPPSTTTTLPPREAAFSDGTHLVGEDIDAGIYETGAVEGTDCSWERLSGTGGTSEEIIASATVDTHAVVEVLAADVALTTTGCGDWYVLAHLTEPLGEIPPGTWVVGVQVEPGSYGAPGGDACSWARLSAFTGELDDIIDQDTVEGLATVDIAAGDAGFTSTECGTWTPSG